MRAPNAAGPIKVVRVTLFLTSDGSSILSALIRWRATIASLSSRHSRTGLRHSRSSKFVSHPGECNVRADI
jgi:hypothetical protein